MVTADDAIAYVKLGWHMLPIWWLDAGRCACGDPECASPGKHPFGRFAPQGYKSASSSQAQIRRWFEREPRCNLAVATGPTSGILVLDVDGSEGERSLAKLEREHGTLDEYSTMQWTGSGEDRWQAFFAYPHGRKVSISAGKLGPKLDTRGAGGYALVPPSETAQPYEWAQDRDPWSIPFEPAPDWLVDLLDPPEPAVPEPYSPTKPVRADRYGWRAMESELALVATASEGRRNNQLNRSAHALYRLVRDGRLYREDVDHALTTAAEHIGLKEREITATLDSAAKARGL